MIRTFPKKTTHKSCGDLKLAWGIVLIWVVVSVASTIGFAVLDDSFARVFWMMTVLFGCSSTAMLWHLSRVARAASQK